MPRSRTSQGTRLFDCPSLQSQKSEEKITWRLKHLQRRHGRTPISSATFVIEKSLLAGREADRPGAAFRSRVLETRDRTQTRCNVRQAATEACTPLRVEPRSAPCSPGF